MEHDLYLAGKWERCHDCDHLEPVAMTDIAEDVKCGGAATNCRHDLWPPSHSKACPISKGN